MFASFSLRQWEAVERWRNIKTNLHKTKSARERLNKADTNRRSFRKRYKSQWNFSEHRHDHCDQSGKYMLSIIRGFRRYAFQLEINKNVIFFHNLLLS